MAKDLTKVSYGAAYDVTFGGADLGLVDDVDPSGIEIVTKELQVGSYGADVILGEIIVAMQGTITVTLRQWDEEIRRNLIMWSPASGTIPMMPAERNSDLYQWAKALKLHPNNLPTSDATRDFNFVKAVAKLKEPSLDGGDWTKPSVEFRFFPDRAQLPDLVYGYFGALPA